MAPRAAAKVGEIMAKEVVRRMVEHSFKKYPGRGKRVGGSRNGMKNMQEGIRRVVEMGCETVERAGGVKNLFKIGIAKAKNEGFMKVAGDLVSFASKGLVQIVNPPGFAAVFKADGTCEFVLRQDPLEGLGNSRLHIDPLYTGRTNDRDSQNLPAAVVKKEVTSDGGVWSYVEIESESKEIKREL